MSEMRKNESPANGFSLIEVMIAMAILLVALGALLGLFTVAVGNNANQGEAGTRVSEFAQDKMEQLLANDFASLGVTNMAASTTVGGTTAGSPVAGYVGYYKADGTAWPIANGSLYVVQWSVGMDATQTLKTVTVFVQALKPLGPGIAPSTILVCYKSKTT
jgi:prepilin-type N-terminal cleavage/methylation domain-containing protein